MTWIRAPSALVAEGTVTESGNEALVGFANADGGTIVVGLSNGWSKGLAPTCGVGTR